MRTITIVNQQTQVSNAEVEAAITAVQTQFTSHLLPAYGRAPVTLQLGANTTAERIYLLDTSDQADALGYHEDNGTPVGYVFVKTTLTDGDHWQATFSHEACEQAIDPYCLDCMLAYFLGTTAIIPRETCDAVENDEYQISGVPVSNFVLPTWFIQNSAGPWDHMGRLTAPLTLSPGGYVSYSTNLQSWRETFGRLTPAHQRKPARFSRRLRRLLRST